MTSSRFPEFSFANVLAPRNILCSATKRRIYQICKAGSDVTSAADWPIARKRRALKSSILLALAKRIFLSWGRILKPSATFSLLNPILYLLP